MRENKGTQQPCRQLILLSQEGRTCYPISLKRKRFSFHSNKARLRNVTGGIKNKLQPRRFPEKRESDLLLVKCGSVSFSHLLWSDHRVKNYKKKEHFFFFSLFGHICYLFFVCLFVCLIKSHCRQLPDSKVQFSLARSGSQPWAVVSADPSRNGLSNRKVGREKTSSWETEIPLCGCLSTGVPCPGGRGRKAGLTGEVRRKTLLWPAAPRAGPHCVPSLFCPLLPPQQLGVAGSLQGPPGKKPSILEET